MDCLWVVSGAWCGVCQQMHQHDAVAAAAPPLECCAGPHPAVYTPAGAIHTHVQNPPEIDEADLDVCLKSPFLMVCLIQLAQTLEVHVVLA